MLQGSILPKVTCLGAGFSVFVFLFFKGLGTFIPRMTCPPVSCAWTTPSHTFRLIFSVSPAHTGCKFCCDVPRNTQIVLLWDFPCLFPLLLACRALGFNLSTYIGNSLYPPLHCESQTQHLCFIHLGHTSCLAMASHMKEVCVSSKWSSHLVPR